MAADSGPQPAAAPISLADYERLAAESLDAGTHAYVFGGAGDEVTLRDNLASWQRFAIRPRVLVGAGQLHRGTTVLGRPRPHPLIVAPMAFQRLVHRDADIATARAAAATNTIMCLPTFSTTTPAALVEALPGAPRWFQLYVFADRGVSRELIGLACELGYEALVVTVDLPVTGVRDRELRHPVPSPRPETAAGPRTAGGFIAPADLGGLIDPDLSWSDIERFAADASIPVVAKGILTPEDARLAVEHGARGVVVSNHGGRQLDTVLAAADALAPIVDAVGDQVDVLVDGGIRRGTDVLKALALGARAVMIGRPVLWGLAVDGTAGARRVLEILLGELDTALALAGAPNAAQLDRSFVTTAPWVAERR
jgi:isopentenyl diphosphate isomerase/L-lactate dehydrogenase-like FMN-dependent dehydrogenase